MAVNRPSTSKPEPEDRAGIIWFFAMAAVVIVGAVLLFVLTSCEPGGPPPIIPNPPPVVPISQCTEVFPAGYTRPVQTNHRWLIYPALPGVRVIRWLDRHCDKWIQGPYDPAHPFTACNYRPQEGDRYYSEQDSFVATPPLGCPLPT